MMRSWGRRIKFRIIMQLRMSIHQPNNYSLTLQIMCKRQKLMIKKRMMTRTLAKLHLTNQGKMSAKLLQLVLLSNRQGINLNLHKKKRLERQKRKRKLKH